MNGLYPHQLILFYLHKRDKHKISLLDNHEEILQTFRKNIFFSDGYS